MVHFMGSSMPSYLLLSAIGFLISFLISFPIAYHVRKRKLAQRATCAIADPVEGEISSDSKEPQSVAPPAQKKDPGDGLTFLSNDWNKEGD